MEESPVCDGVPRGDPVTASAYDNPGDTSLELLAWLDAVGDAIYLHILHPMHPSKSHFVVTGCVFRRWSSGDSVISAVGFQAYVGTKRFLVVKMPTGIII